MTEDREPVLVVFDIDGTLAKHGDPNDPDQYSEARLAALEPIPNMIAMARRYIKTPNVVVMFCSGRPKTRQRVTWDWLNHHVGMSGGRAVTLTLRPESESEDRIAMYKLSEIIQAVRRMGSKPSEVVIFDDDIMNLQMFESVRPMVRRLKLYKVEDGLTSQWGEGW